MLRPTDSRITVAPVVPVAAPQATEAAGDARQEAFQRSLAGLVGKSMQGEVLSKLTDGSFIVRVAGAPARMLLPPGAQVGADIPLTLLAITPRPTFQVGGEGGQLTTTYAEAGPLLPGPAGSPARAAPMALPEGAPDAAGAASARATANAAALLGKAPIVPAERLAAIEFDASAAILSPAARAITGVLGAAQKSTRTQTSIIGRTPLLDGAPDHPAKLAAALGDAIGSSGLFYESHLAEWSGGQRALAELAREPQMQRAFGSAVAGAGAADPDAAQFVNLQLSSHEHAHVAWQGQAWPGQDLHWEISRDAPGGRRGGAESEPEPGWRSALRLRFPLLGEIAATLVMSGEQLHIELKAGSADAGALLRRHADALGAALDAGGTPLASLSIQTQPGASDD